MKVNIKRRNNYGFNKHEVNKLNQLIAKILDWPHLQNQIYDKKSSQQKQSIFELVLEAPRKY